MEHRQAVRLRVFWPVGLVASHECDSGLMANISRDGMFVRSAANIDVGKCVDVQIPRSRHDDYPVTVKALVVHRETRGFGLMFRDHHEEIDAIIEQLSQDRPSQPMPAGQRYS